MPEVEFACGSKSHSSTRSSRPVRSAASEVDARRGLAHAALLIDNRNDFRQHRSHLLSCFQPKTFNDYSALRPHFQQKAKKSAAPAENVSRETSQNATCETGPACFT
jgi:hypothetical protein